MRVVLTGGGTIAPIDEVRHVANASTGRFSAEIAEAFLDRGDELWHVHAPGALLPFARSAAFDLDAPDPAAEHDRLARLAGRWREVRGRFHPVPLATGTVPEYAEALRRTLEVVRPDAVLLAMAASDYAPEPAEGKIDSGPEERTLRLRRQPKVIRSVRDWAPGAYLVGFKLLAGSTPADLVAAAEAANRQNRADLTVANDLRAYRAGGHTVHLVRPGRRAETLGPGGAVAAGLVERVSAWAGDASLPGGAPGR